MFLKTHKLSAIALFVITLVVANTQSANATIVLIETSQGDFEVNLYDNGTPATVSNFLNYVQNGNYSDSIFHRSVDAFIVQSGGFSTDMNAQISAIPANAAVANEPVFSNVRGTIAMAKVGGNPNSATNQWFINLGNNAAALDAQNGGFTVFGEVTGSGMTSVDAIAALPRFAFAAPLGELPLQNYTSTDFANAVPVDNSHLVIISAITVIDTTVDSAGVASLNPPTNNSAATGGGGSSSGGGSLGTIALLCLLMILLSRRKLFA